MITAQAFHNVKQEEPDYDNLQNSDDSSSDHGGNSATESEDEEELNGIVLRKSLLQVSAF